MSIRPFAGYQRRVVDAELDELMPHLPAVSLEGPKGIGKTSTAERRARTVLRLDHPGTLEVVGSQPDILSAGPPPVLIDEWQLYPASWDVVRRAVDADPAPGRFLLTGSASPIARPTHSGAGRIVAVRMRPLTLPERGVEEPSVFLSALLTGRRPPVNGTTDVTLTGYTSEILTGGFPGIRHAHSRSQRAALDGYLQRVVDIDLPELGVHVRNPAALSRWLRAYAAATSTTTSYEKIRNAATPGEDDKPAKTTVIDYRDALERVWILDPLPAWAPTASHFNRLLSAPKHHLADPALAARLVSVDESRLLRGEGPTVIPRDGTFLGALFESLAAMTLRVFAQATEARVWHFRDRNGRREVDFVVSGGDGRVVALEAKLTSTVDDRDVAHLRWLADQLGDELLDAVVLTTGRHAYRRWDGIAVVPLALLGP